MASSITVDDHNTAEEWLNKLAREAPDGQLFPDEYDFDDVVGLAHALGETMVGEPEDVAEHENAERLRELQDTALSRREAEVVLLKERGMTHDAIALYYSLKAERGDGDYPSSVSTVDEYSRRAREKYKKALRTVDALWRLYDEDTSSPPLKPGRGSVE